MMEPAQLGDEWGEPERIETYADERPTARAARNFLFSLREEEIREHHDVEVT